MVGVIIFNFQATRMSPNAVSTGCGINGEKLNIITPAYTYGVKRF